MRRACLRESVVLLAVGTAATIAFCAAGGDGKTAKLTSISTTQAFERSSQSVAQIYFNDFDDTPAGPEWSATKVSFTEKGDRPYLGDFLPNKEPVTLTLKNLPAHKLVRITFDLFLKRSWDGSSPIWGDTIWDMQLDDGRNLIHTTFCNCGFFNDNDEQAFPDTYPARPHIAWTGAAENRSLGCVQSWGGPDRTFDPSSVYHFDLTFPHSSGEIVFGFSSKMKGDLTKTFGLTNVRVQTLSDFVRHTDAELTRMWADLGAAQYPRFFTAQWNLIASGDAAVSFLERHIKERNDLSDSEIRDLLNEFRKTSGQPIDDPILMLISQGGAATTPINDALADSNFPEDKKEILTACKKLIERYPQSATDLRLQRARQLLQVIHTDAALKLAKQYAQ
jgi:hypothetical protein